MVHPFIFKGESEKDLNFAYLYSMIWADLIFQVCIALPQNQIETIKLGL